MNTGELPLSDFADTLKEILADGGTFKMYPKGNSMLPLIRGERDAVILTAPEPLKKQDVILFRRENGAFVLHRLIDFLPDETCLVCGDSQTWTETVKKDRIFAKIAEIRRGRHTVTAESVLYRIYIFLWSRYLPRRCYIRCRRFRRRLCKPK